MKIVTLEIVNQRSIRAFSSNPDGDNVAVAGDTSTGKTTAISALWDIMTRRSDNLTHGAKRGRTTVKLSDGTRTITATRSETPKTSTIDIKADDGQKISPKQLKDMLSDLSVNPHLIMSMKPQERTQRLLNAADLGDYNLSAKDTEIDQLETQRLDAHRKAEDRKPGDEPERAEVVDIAEAMREKDKADEANKEREQSQQLIDGLYENETSLSDQIIKLENDLIEKNKELKELTGRIDKGKTYIAKLPEAIATAPIIERIANAQQINQKAAAYQAWETRADEHAEALDLHSDLSAKVKSEKSKRADALNSAKWPLDGLMISNGDILYNDMLMENLGESQQMLVCAALAVSDIKAHPIHVVRMDGIESMSKEDFNELTALFNKHDIQVLSSRVSRGDVDDGEIVISEGVFTGE